MICLGVYLFVIMVRCESRQAGPQVGAFAVYRQGRNCGRTRVSGPAGPSVQTGVLRQLQWHSRAGEVAETSATRHNNECARPIGTFPTGLKETF